MNCDSHRPWAPIVAMMRPRLDKTEQHSYISPFVAWKYGLAREWSTVLKAGHHETMSSHLMPTKSSLLAVALVVRSKDGPRFVFHYPPRLTARESQELPRYGTELDPTTPDTSDDEGSSGENDFEEDVYHLNKKYENPGQGKRSRHVSLWDGDEHFDSAEGLQIVPWEHLDAFSTKDLASILTPAKPYHKKCFQLTLDPLHIVTYPMHIREDGRWKKRKRSKKKRRDEEVTTGSDSWFTKNSVVTEVAEEPSETSTPEDPEQERTASKATNGSGGGSENGQDDGGMTMFNLVFILNPGRIDATSEVANVFEHVAKDVNKALRYAQNYSSYVWRESDMILTMKDRAREKSKYTLSSSLHQN
jgi:hypothetical protein